MGSDLPRARAKGHGAGVWAVGFQRHVLARVFPFLV